MRRGRTTVDGRAKYRVLKGIADACKKHSVPPLDERLKSIVASMVGSLLRGGQPEEDITHVAIELALKYDHFHAHESMLALQRVVEQRYWDAETGDEPTSKLMRQKAADAEPMDPRVAKILGVAKRDPRNLPGNHRADGDPCKICQGPPGVHVKFQNIPQLEAEAMAQLERNRQVRRPMRTLGEVADLARARSGEAPATGRVGSSPVRAPAQAVPHRFLPRAETPPGSDTTRDDPAAVSE